MEEENKMVDYQLKGKVILKGKIIIETGLAIGGSKTSLDIGGMDNPVIKDSKGFPYIPGSTIKGKLRSLLEQSLYPLRNNDKGDGLGYFDPRLVIHKFKDETKYSEDPICKIFGIPDTNEPGRGIFRDSYLDLEHFEQNRTQLFKNIELEFTEDKIENTVDRISAVANPRHLERVPTGTNFDFEIILDLFSEDDKPLLTTLFQGLKLLEDDYLGGSGSRGSGKITFDNMSMEFRSIDYYSAEKDPKLLADQFNLKDLKNQPWFTNGFSEIDF